LLERLVGASAAELGEMKTIGGGADCLAGTNLDALFVFEKAQGLVDDRKRQPRMPCDLHADQVTVQIKLLEDQVAHLGERQAALGQ
jgi:hypothetical protein